MRSCAPRMLLSVEARPAAVKGCRFFLSSFAMENLEWAEQELWAGCLCSMYLSGAQDGWRVWSAPGAAPEMSWGWGWALSSAACQYPPLTAGPCMAWINARVVEVFVEFSLDLCAVIGSLCIHVLLSMFAGFPSVTSGLDRAQWSAPEASQLRLLSPLTCGASGTEFKLHLCLHSGLIFLLSSSGLLHWAHWCATDEAAA